MKGRYIFWVLFGISLFVWFEYSLYHTDIPLKGFIFLNFLIWIVYELILLKFYNDYYFNDDFVFLKKYSIIYYINKVSDTIYEKLKKR